MNKEMSILNHKGLTLIETLAAILIISIVMVSTMTILANARVQSRASEELLISGQVAIMFANYVTTHMNETENKEDLVTYMADVDPGIVVTLNPETCEINFGQVFCDTIYHFQPIAGRTYNEDNVIVTMRKNTESEHVIIITVTILYYLERQTSVEAYIYV